MSMFSSSTRYLSQMVKEVNKKEKRNKVALTERLIIIIIIFYHRLLPKWHLFIYFFPRVTPNQEVVGGRKRFGGAL